MVAEPYIMQGHLNSEIEDAVAAGFSESGLVGKLTSTGSESLIQGLKGYVVILLAAFTHRGAMYGRYQRERAKFAALAGDYYFDAVLGNIQTADLALFHGGLFFGGVYRREEAADAKKAYGDVAVLLRGNRDEHGFFVFLSRNTLPVMDGLGFTATHLRLPRPKETPIILPSLESYMGRG
ncbi:hypothetical protein HYU40_03230 [Candidatus Woesearchaeota archaeon]|nr:hypothetical protein [Candidatus Woesearchaeota archaeon]